MQGTIESPFLTPSGMGSSPLVYASPVELCDCLWFTAAHCSPRNHLCFWSAHLSWKIMVWAQGTAVCGRGGGQQPSLAAKQIKSGVPLTWNYTFNNPHCGGRPWCSWAVGMNAHLNGDYRSPVYSWCSGVASLDGFSSPIWILGSLQQSF